MDSAFTFVTWFGFTMLGALVVLIVDHFFVFNKHYKPSGELIFEKINEDEAKVDLKLYDDCLYNTVNAKEVIFKVVKKGE